MARPQDLNYLLILPNSPTAIGLQVELALRPTLRCQFLSERHHLILGLNENLSMELARVILADAGRLVLRLKQKDLESVAPRLLEAHADLHSFLTEGWKQKLGLP
jgi:hypothetical protein